MLFKIEVMSDDDKWYLWGNYSEDAKPKALYEALKKYNKARIGFHIYTKEMES